MQPKCLTQINVLIKINLNVFKPFAVSIKIISKLFASSSIFLARSVGNGSDFVPWSEHYFGLLFRVTEFGPTPLRMPTFWFSGKRVASFRSLICSVHIWVYIGWLHLIYKFNLNVIAWTPFLSIFCRPKPRLLCFQVKASVRIHSLQ